MLQNRICFKRSKFVFVYLFPGGVLPKTGILPKIFSQKISKIHKKTTLQDSLFTMKLEACTE